MAQKIVQISRDTRVMLDNSDFPIRSNLIAFLNRAGFGLAPLAN